MMDQAPAQLVSPTSSASGVVRFLNILYMCRWYILIDLFIGEILMEKEQNNMLLAPSSTRTERYRDGECRCVWSDDQLIRYGSSLILVTLNLFFLVN